MKAIANQFNIENIVLRLNKRGELELPIQKYESDEEYKWEDGKENAKEMQTNDGSYKSDKFALVVKNKPK